MCLRTPKAVGIVCVCTLKVHPSIVWRWSVVLVVCHVTFYVLCTEYLSLLSSMHVFTLPPVWNSVEILWQIWCMELWNLPLGALFVRPCSLPLCGKTWALTRSHGIIGTVYKVPKSLCIGFADSLCGVHVIGYTAKVAFIWCTTTYIGRVPQ